MASAQGHITVRRAALPGADGAPGKDGANFNLNMFRQSDFAKTDKWEHVSGNRVDGYNGQYAIYGSYSGGNWDNAYCDICRQLVTLIAGNQYTISAYVKGTGQIRIYTWVDVGNSIKNYRDETYALTSEWQRITYTVTADTTVETYCGYFRIIDGEAYVCMPKLEEGDTATSWCLHADELKGNGIASVQEHYATSDSNVNAPADGEFQSAFLSPTADKPYLWNYETISYTDGSTPFDSQKRVIGMYTKDGRGISSIKEYYGTSTGQGTEPSSWAESMVGLAFNETYKYMWNYEEITYSDGTTHTSSKRIIGTYGNGRRINLLTDGLTEKTASTYLVAKYGVKTPLVAGKTYNARISVTVPSGVKQIGVYLSRSMKRNTAFAVSGSGTHELTGSFVAAYADGYAPADYATNAEVWLYQNMDYGGSSTPYEVTVNSVTIDAGDVLAETRQYAAGTSRSTAPTDGWQSAPPTLTGSQYLWERDYYTFANGTDLCGDAVCVSGEKGDTGSRGPALRGPQDWSKCEDGYGFQAGGDGDEYKDLVLYDGNFYSCKKNHTKTSANYPGSTADTNNGYWQLGNKVSLIAAQILLSEYALVKNLGVETVESKDADGNIIFQAMDGNVTCKGDITANSMRLKVIPSGGKLTDGAFIIDTAGNSDGVVYTAPQLTEGEVVEVKFIIPGATTRSFYGFTIKRGNNNVKLDNTFKNVFDQSSIVISSDYCGHMGILIGIGYSSTETRWTLTCI